MKFPTAVVHLVRAINGMAPFEAFIASYERHEAGASHDLVLLFKGFEDSLAVVPYVERAANLRPLTLHLPEIGTDVTAYMDAARRLEHHRVCFLNSFSEIVADRWLAKLESALQQPGVGAAGATGSWGSHLSYNLFQAGRGGPYARAFPGRREARRAMHSLTGSPERAAPFETAYASLQALRDARSMPPFPAAHLRTNAFVIDRERLIRLHLDPGDDKRAAYRFEGGRNGLSAQLRAQGRRVIVVDREGRAHEEQAWNRTETFWQGQQQQPLVHDNQTRAYANASPAVQQVLSAFAWGPNARQSA